MLREPLISAFCACLMGALTTGWANAQIAVDAPVVLTGTADQRAIDGVAPPTHGTSAITVEGSVLASYMWATSSQTGNVINLSTTPSVTEYADGLNLRFLVSTPAWGALQVSVDGLPALPLINPDGLPLHRGQLEAGTLAEVLYSGGQYILLSGPERTCPSGFSRVNDEYCIETNPPSTAGTWQWAIAKCTSLGGNLCTWGEYASACTILGNQLTGMHQNWEWLDDTSNHTHGADSAGRFTCMSQRTTLITVTAKARCCFHMR